MFGFRNDELYKSMNPFEKAVIWVLGPVSWLIGYIVGTLEGVVETIFNLFGV